MTNKNDLLHQDILEKIENERYEKPKKKKNRHSILYMILAAIIIFSALFSLMRYLISW
ncbi:hypothetical protein [Streptococcus orisratti]|uniref:hypothetical protein n=1 Tax=Streptococcus orisratti TaxID=114652 RepID=UPI003CFFD7BA